MELHMLYDELRNYVDPEQLEFDRGIAEMQEQLAAYEAQRNAYDLRHANYAIRQGWGLSNYTNAKGERFYGGPNPNDPMRNVFAPPSTGNGFTRGFAGKNSTGGFNNGGQSTPPLKTLVEKLIFNKAPLTLLHSQLFPKIRRWFKQTILHQPGNQTLQHRFKVTYGTPEEIDYWERDKSRRVISPVERGTTSTFNFSYNKAFRLNIGWDQWSTLTVTINGVPTVFTPSQENSTIIVLKPGDRVQVSLQANGNNSTLTIMPAIKKKFSFLFPDINIKVTD